MEDKVAVEDKWEEEGQEMTIEVHHQTVEVEENKEVMAAEVEEEMSQGEISIGKKFHS